MNIEQAERMVRSYSSGLPEHAYGEIVQEWQRVGFSNSCVWHETWRWHRQNTEYPSCEICGGFVRVGETKHHLCQARKDRGQPIEVLDSRPECGCAGCR